MKKGPLLEVFFNQNFQISNIFLDVCYHMSVLYLNFQSAKSTQSSSKSKEAFLRGRSGGRLVGRVGDLPLFLQVCTFPDYDDHWLRSFVVHIRDVQLVCTDQDCQLILLGFPTVSKRSSLCSVLIIKQFQHKWLKEIHINWSELVEIWPFLEGGFEPKVLEKSLSSRLFLHQVKKKNPLLLLIIEPKLVSSFKSDFL